MKLFADYHTHTTYSDGRGTIQENVYAARKRGLKELAITDHGPNNIGTGVRRAETYIKIKEDIRKINHQWEDINVLVGSEADIISVDGKIDIPSHIINELDLLLVGLHPFVLPDTINDGVEYVLNNQVGLWSKSIKEKVRNTNTKALIQATENYDVDFITHPNLKMPVDLPELAQACIEKEVALEINTGHQYDKSEIIEETASYGVKYIVNSDAHFPDTVGKIESGLELLEHYAIPVENIVNAE